MNSLTSASVHSRREKQPPHQNGQPGGHRETTTPSKWPAPAPTVAATQSDGQPGNSQQRGRHARIAASPKTMQQKGCTNKDTRRVHQMGAHQKGAPQGSLLIQSLSPNCKSFKTLVQPGPAECPKRTARMTADPIISKTMPRPFNLH